MTHAATNSDRSRSIGWLDALFCIAIIAAAVVGMLDAWRDIYRLGRLDEELGYVLLAPVVIGWLVWTRRRRLRDCPITAQWLGLLAVAGGAAIYWYGYHHDPAVWRAGAVITAVAAFPAALGLRAAWRWAPAVAATIFLIPIDPNGRWRFAGPLQTITAEMTQNVCGLLGIPVDRAGNLLTVNGVGVTVVEACNGMRMMLTLFLVCYVVAFTIPLRGYVRLLFLLATPLVAVVANVIRLVPTVWMYGHRTAEAAERFHDISGWVMTGVSFLLLLGFFTLLRRATEADDDDGSVQEDGVTGVIRRRQTA